MNEDKVIEKLLEHDTRFDKMEEKFSSSLQSFRNEYLAGQDQIMKILIRLDEERIFTREAIRRMQEELDQQKVTTAKHETTLKKIMLHLNLA